MAQKTLKIFFLSDIHIDSRPENRQLWELFCELCLKENPRVIIIAGDLASSTERVSEGLQLFQKQNCKKLYVPGNHDFWGTSNQNTSVLEKHRSVLPEICAENDWIYLPNNPVIISDIAFVGTPGWYDYSLMPEKHPFTTADFQKKTRAGRKWQDAVRCCFDGLSDNYDEELSALFFQELEADLKKAHNHKTLRKTVLISHFLFHQRLLNFTEDWDFNYFGAFMGSKRYQKLFAPYQISHHICGHLHRQQYHYIDQTEVFLNPVGYLREWGTSKPLAWLNHILGVLDL